MVRQAVPRENKINCLFSSPTSRATWACDFSWRNCLSARSSSFSNHWKSRTTCSETICFDDPSCSSSKLYCCDSRNCESVTAVLLETRMVLFFETSFPLEGFLSFCFHISFRMLPSETEKHSLTKVFFFSLFRLLDVFLYWALERFRASSSHAASRYSTLPAYPMPSTRRLNVCHLNLDTRNS